MLVLIGRVVNLCGGKFGVSALVYVQCHVQLALGVVGGGA